MLASRIDLQRARRTAAVLGFLFAQRYYSRSRGVVDISCQLDPIFEFRSSVCVDIQV